MIVPVILSGGSGTRLWPLSREAYPKQFLPLVDQYTMLQNTALRVGAAKNIAAPLVVCNQEHRFMVAEQLRAVGVQPAMVILEPIGDSGANGPQYRAGGGGGGVARPAPRRRSAAADPAGRSRHRRWMAKAFAPPWRKPRFTPKRVG